MPHVRRLPSSALALAFAVVLAVAACAPGDALPPGEPLGTPGAHEHGVARLDLAVDGEALVAQLVLPDLSLQGFEHVPRTDEERAARAEALGKLRASFADLIVFEGRAGCALETLALYPDVSDAVEAHDHAHAHDAGHAHAHDHAHADDAGHTHDDADAHEHTHGATATGDQPAEPHGHDHAHQHEHTETRAEARFLCDRDPTGTTVELVFARHFPGIERVDLQSLSSGRQFGRRVAADGTRFVL